MVVAENHPFIARGFENLLVLRFFWFRVLGEIEQSTAVLGVELIPGQFHFLAWLRCRRNASYVKVVGIRGNAADVTNVRVPTVPRSLADVTPVHGSAVP